jgi:hypothetical protein
MFKCHGCGIEVEEAEADHIFHCEGEGWKKVDKGLGVDMAEIFAECRKRIGLREDKA